MKSMSPSSGSINNGPVAHASEWASGRCIGSVRFAIEKNKLKKWIIREKPILIDVHVPLD